MKKWILMVSVVAVALVFALGLGSTQMRVQAQTTAPTPAATTPGTNVQGMLYACATNAIINFNGTMLAGWDIYYQLVSASGNLTGVRQVAAAGTFRFSEVVTYDNNLSVSPSTAVAARVFVARESDPTAIDFEFNLTDVQDGCDGVTPQNEIGVSVVAGTDGSAGTTGSGNAVRIAAPGGTTLNPNLEAEDPVVIGARQSENFRSATPGLIFAECNEAELANPGIVYDNDNVTVFWSWFTRTQAQMEEHLATSQYSVRMNSAAFSPVQVSDIERRGSQYWVFYSAPVGYLRPGHYEVEYQVTWSEAHFDGYDDYGPGTSNVRDTGNCNFDVLRNPNNQSVPYTGMFFPTEYPWHNIYGDT